MNVSDRQTYTVTMIMGPALAATMQLVGSVFAIAVSLAICASDGTEHQ